jgi:hypothetical protein
MAAAELAAAGAGAAAASSVWQECTALLLPAAVPWLLAARSFSSAGPMTAPALMLAATGEPGAGPAAGPSAGTFGELATEGGSPAGAGKVVPWGQGRGGGPPPASPHDSVATACSLMAGRARGAPLEVAGQAGAGVGLAMLARAAWLVAAAGGCMQRACSCCSCCCFCCCCCPCCCWLCSPNAADCRSSPEET